MKGQLWLLLLLAIVFFVVMVVVLNDGEENGASMTFSLQSPIFVEAVHASSQIPSMTIHERIKGEAGISAYCRAPGPIDLGKVVEHFTTLEVQTADYLLGSVSFENYPEIYDPHAYVHKDGWILVYYFHHEPIGKIVDVQAKDIQRTKLSNMVAQILIWAELAPAHVKYYHFQHPEATHMMFVAETYDAGDNEFHIQLPPTFLYYERSWALANTGGRKFFKVNAVDQVTLSEINSMDRVWRGNSGYGRIRMEDMAPNKMHTISVDSYGVLVLLYQAPD